MSDPRAKIANLWNSSSRFKTFGNALTKIIVRGVRCHDETTIDLRSPVTAFTGFNGTGKSTLLQLAASAYKSSMNLTINSFIRKGPLDKDVFSPNASFYSRFHTTLHHYGGKATLDDLNEKSFSVESRFFCQEASSRILFFAIHLY